MKQAAPAPARADVIDDYSRACVPEAARVGALSIAQPAFIAGASMAGTLGMERAVGAFLPGAGIIALDGLLIALMARGMLHARGH